MKKNAKRITILALFLGGLLVFAAFVVVESTPTTYKYKVINVGGTYYAKSPNGTTLTSGTNAATVINAALSALTPSRTVKEKVLLQGTFVLTSSIRMPSYSILEVAPGGRVEAESGASINLIAGSNTNNFEIVGGDWDASKIVNGSGAAIELSNITDATVSSLKVHDSYYDNMEIDSSSRVIVSNVESYNPGHTALVMGRCSDCVVENCHFHDCGGGGCYFLCEEGLTNCITNDNVLRDNLVERTQLSGLSLASLRGASDVGNNNLAEHNTCIDCGLDGAHPGLACGWGDGMARPTNCIIRYNTIYETGAYAPPNGNGCDGGIETYMSDSQVYGNVIHDISGLGISCNGDRNTVSDNEVTNCGILDNYASIEISNGSNNQVLKNTIKSCLVGVHLYSEGGAGCNHTEVAGNHFESMTNFMIEITSSACTGNVIENNFYTGIWRVYDEGTGTIVMNNIIAP